MRRKAHKKITNHDWSIKFAKDRTFYNPSTEHPTTPEQ